MGRIYRATQFPLNRPVAVKVLRSDFQEKDPQFVQRFFLEAVSAARLSHANTITVFDYGEADTGELFMVMEYLKGQPLSRVLRTKGALDPERTVHIAAQICRSVREAHELGIIHRDLKPGNIFLIRQGDDHDFVRVLDFGLVKLQVPERKRREGSGDAALIASAVDETHAGMFLGSPKYMSPEQIEAKTIDLRTDIYSVGVILYRMLTGHPPFDGRTSAEIVFKHVHHEVPEMRQKAPSLRVSGALQALVMKCLAKEPSDRFDTMTELIGCLETVRRRRRTFAVRRPVNFLATECRVQDTVEPEGVTERMFENTEIDPVPRGIARTQRKKFAVAVGVAVVSLGLLTIGLAEWPLVSEMISRVGSPRVNKTLGSPSKPGEAVERGMVSANQLLSGRRSTEPLSGR